MTTDFGTPDQVLDYGPIDVSCTDWTEWIQGKLKSYLFRML